MNTEPFPRILAGGCGVTFMTFEDGYVWIRAMAERKLLAQAYPFAFSRRGRTEYQTFAGQLSDFVVNSSQRIDDI
jgi:hypothetical protein